MNPLSDDAPSWVMVQDNLTGLVWENKTDDGSFHDKVNLYTWERAMEFGTTLNSQNFGGHNDWRLPTTKELSTIVDSSIPYPGPTINTDYFPNTKLSCYWSSTTDVGNPYHAWYVYFSGGDVGYNYKSTYYRVRVVRGEQCVGNYVDNGNGTVTDISTGLMWQQDTAPDTYNWQEALSYCEDLTLAEYDDWRLPNRNELQSLQDYSQYNPSIDTAFFPNTVSSHYWSSTTDVGGPYYAWLVGFLDGYVYYYDKTCSYYYVRAVRGGQCGSSDTSTTTTIPGSTTSTISGSTTTTIPESTTTIVQPCPSEQIYGEHSEKAELLRYFRDNVLSQTPEGREIIKRYYELSPVIVQMMNEDAELRRQVKEMMDGILGLIGKAE